MTEPLLKKLKTQSLKSLLDIILLHQARGTTITGYDAMHHIQDVYGVLISAGTIYAHLYSLERDGLITSNIIDKSRVFEITEKGNEIFEIAKERTIELLTTFEQKSTQS